MAKTTRFFLVARARSDAAQAGQLPRALELTQDLRARNVALGNGILAERGSLASSGFFWLKLLAGWVDPKP